MRLTPNKIY